MKKRLCALLLCLIALIAFIGCNGNADPDNGSTAQNPTYTPTTPPDTPESDDPYLASLTRSVSEYMKSQRFGGSLVANSTQSRLPLQYLKYVKGSAFGSEDMLKSVAYLDQIRSLMQDGVIYQDKWNDSQPKKTGFKSVADYIFAWSEIYNQYVQYSISHNLTIGYESELKAVKDYLNYCALFLSDLQFTRGDGGHLDTTRPHDYQAKGEDAHEVQEGCTCLFTYFAHEAGTYNVFKQDFYGYIKYLYGVDGYGEKRKTDLSKTFAALAQVLPVYGSRAADKLSEIMDRCELIAADPDAQPLYTKQNYAENYSAEVDSMLSEIRNTVVPSFSGGWCFSGTDEIMCAAADLGLDATELFAPLVKEKLEIYATDGDKTAAPPTPNWNGFSGHSLSATLLTQKEGFDINYEKSVRYYFPVQDTGMATPTAEQRVTMDVMAKSYEQLKANWKGGASVNPEYLLLTAMAFGLDMTDYQPSDGGEKCDVLSAWLADLQKNESGDYIITTNGQLAVFIARICQLKGIAAPTPLGAYNADMGVITV